jgi:hypothetical protein
MHTSTEWIAKGNEIHQTKPIRLHEAGKNSRKAPNFRTGKREVTARVLFSVEKSQNTVYCKIPGRISNTTGQTRLCPEQVTIGRKLKST